MTINIPEQPHVNPTYKQVAREAKQLAKEAMEALRAKEAQEAKEAKEVGQMLACALSHS